MAPEIKLVKRKGWLLLPSNKTPLVAKLEFKVS
jgi:hypothetical protein